MTGISFHINWPLPSQLHGSFLKENNCFFHYGSNSTDQTDQIDFQLKLTGRRKYVEPHVVWKKQQARRRPSKRTVSELEDEDEEDQASEIERRFQK
jgi:hypothetical protein